MRLATCLPLLIFAVTAAPTAKEHSLVVTRDFFLDTNVKYTGHHDIVNILVPLNKINFDDDDDNNDGNEHFEDVTVFFVEADINDKGERNYHGLFVLKNGTATKILENGHDATALNDDSHKVYIGASDGIYVYDGINGSTNKYGSLTDNIIQIEADNKTGVIYFVTNDHKVFSIADNATKKNKVDLKDVQEIAIDFSGNLYYYDNKKDLYVVNKNVVKKVEDIPKRNEIKLVRPMFALEEGVFAIVDDELYMVNANGSADKMEIIFEVKPTAYAPEATLIQYFALVKKLYEFNAIQIIASEIKGLKLFLQDKRDEIQTIATKSRKTFGS